MKKILIIEDDEVTARIYGNKLTARKHQVQVALDGETGWELFKSFEPDLVVLDLMLPTLSGLDLLRMIRSRATAEQVPVIVFSSAFLGRMLAQAQELGASQCFSKANCTPVQVLDAIYELLQPPPPPMPAPAPKSAEEEAADAAGQEALREEFLESLPDTLVSLRSTLLELNKIPDEAGRAVQLKELFRKMRCLTGNAGITGLWLIAEMADALQALLQELCEKPRHINASSLRTVALAVDVLGQLFDQSHLPEARAARSLVSARVLVVDDESVSRRAMVLALETVRLQPLVASDATGALELLASQSFDLIFLDVLMPGLSGFQLCTRIRGVEAHRNTPIVFVTGLTNFETRASSILSGGSDLIAKPFLFLELGVRALVYLLRVRLNPAK